jgi:chaperonin cofactor prefoldin
MDTEEYQFAQTIVADHCQLCDALEEANETLQAEVTRLRNSNRVLRTVNSHLRGQLTIAHNNDEVFKEFCLNLTNVAT